MSQSIFVVLIALPSSLLWSSGNCLNQLTTYTNKNGGWFCFLSNPSVQDFAFVDLQQDGKYNLPPWSVSILQGCNFEVFNTAKVIHWQVRSVCSLNDRKYRWNWFYQWCYSGVIDVAGECSNYDDWLQSCISQQRICSAFMVMDPGTKDGLHQGEGHCIYRIETARSEGGCRRCQRLPVVHNKVQW